MNRSWRRRAVLGRYATVVWLAALAACGGPTQPPSGSQGLSIAAPAEGQVLAGTVTFAARGTGTDASNVQFTLGGVAVVAQADGTAYFDTRQLGDGEHALVATATVSGKAVTDQIEVKVDNDISASGEVGTAGGALKSDAGSIAMFQPGALASTTQVIVTDTTQEQILDDFGVDYPALGVTFLGALTVDTDGTDVGLPVSVDLAGWANAVQPGQAVVMFALAPDADFDGIGELVLAASAEATGTGSVVTRPVPGVELYTQGVGPSAQQTLSAKPGELIRLGGRGLNLLAPLGNVARYGAPTSPSAETLAFVETEDVGGFDPLLDIWVAVPNLPGGQDMRVHNLTTGYRTVPLDVSVGQVGSGSSSDWFGFLEQVEVAATVAANGRPDLEAYVDGWLAQLGSGGGAIATAMATNSGLVSSENLTALEGISSGALSPDERRLVAKHALVLDAIAASGTSVATPAADLATLLATSWSGTIGTAGLSAQQAGGPSCSGGGSTPSSGIVWGQPVTTGMGSAPPGSCLAGNGSGPGGTGPSSAATRGTAMAASLDEAALATTSLRAGSFLPVEGAVVVVYRPGSSQRLAPFTALTDPTGYFKVPFVPPGEPYVVRAIDPATGRIAEAAGNTAGINVATLSQLLFTATDSGPGSPTADFTITAVPDPDFEGSVYYDFDAGSSTDDGEIVEYVWYFDGYSASVGDDPTTRRGFGRNGSYTIRLTVVDDEGKFGTAEQTLLIDDLPYDYWGSPPVLVSALADGTPVQAEAENRGFSITPDGRYVAFSMGSESENPDFDLLPEDTNGLRDVYLKDLQTGELVLVSEGDPGQFTSHIHVSLSADARYVAYLSQPDLDGARWRVHVRDMQTGEVKIIGPFASDLLIGPASLSADGRTLLYAAQGDVSDPDLRGAYVRDLETDTTEKLGIPQADPTVLAITPSAGHALVRSGEALYVVDLANDTVTQANTNGAGEAADRSVVADFQAMSADGRYVVFGSAAGNLVAQPLTEFRDHIFLKDMETGEVTLVTVNPLNGAEADASSRQPVISPDGSYVYFSAFALNLVPGVQEPGPDFDNCSLEMCSSGQVLAYEVATGRFGLAEVGFDHTASCCGFSSNRLIAVGDSHVAFASYNEQLSETGGDDFMRVYRAVNPFEAP